MRLKRYEIIVIILAFLVVGFTAGFFVGRHNAHTEVVINGGSTDVQEYGGDTVPEPEKEPEKDDEKSKLSDKTEMAAEGKININTADAETLAVLPGIGEVLSERIVKYRDEHGAFASIEEIVNVSGIGESIFNGIKDIIVVE